MKKKWTKLLALLCMVACVFSLTTGTVFAHTTTGTSVEEEAETIEVSDVKGGVTKELGVTYSDETAAILQAEIIEYEMEGYTVESYIETVLTNMIDSIELFFVDKTTEELEKLYNDNSEAYYYIEDYLAATKDAGEYKYAQEDLTFEADENTMYISGVLKYEKKDVVFSYFVDYVNSVEEWTFESADTSVAKADDTKEDSDKLSMGEILEKAGMNTLLGMGTVFLVLILISVVIACFGLFSKVGSGSKTEVKQAPAVPQAAATPTTAATPAVPTQPAGIPDEVEMAIVIATAIAAAEEETGSDGYRVRSIKRAKNSKWRRS